MSFLDAAWAAVLRCSQRVRSLLRSHAATRPGAWWKVAELTMLISAILLISFVVMTFAFMKTLLLFVAVMTNVCTHLCRVGTKKVAHPTVRAAACTRLAPKSAEWMNVEVTIRTGWMPERGTMRPIREIHKISACSAVQDAYTRKCKAIGDVGDGRPGNPQLRFHGTKLGCNFSGQPCESGGRDCPACSIIKEGFNIEYLSNGSGNSGVFGAGHYTTSKSSTAIGYPPQAPEHQRCLLIVAVAVGRAERVMGPTKVAIPEGYDSRVVDKPTGVDELVVPNDDQMLPRYLVLF